MTSGTNAGLAAEFHVASQLARLGYTVTLTIGQHKMIDIIVAHPDGRIATIDAKGLKDTTTWPLKPKKRDRTHFFALVGYHNKFGDLAAQPQTFIIPSTEIDMVLTPWGTTDQAGVNYSKVKNGPYREAWSLIFPNHSG